MISSASLSALSVPGVPQRPLADPSRIDPSRGDAPRIDGARAAAASGNVREAKMQSASPPIQLPLQMNNPPQPGGRTPPRGSLLNISV